MQGANQLRDKMHVELGKSSTNCLQVDASKSSHFVWVDQPELIVDAVKTVIAKNQNIHSADTNSLQKPQI